MAQKSNKSRIVIWTIVGILVVVAVVFLIGGKKSVPPGTRDIDVDDISGFTGRMERMMGQEERRLSKLRADYGPADEFGQIDELLSKARVSLEELQGLTDAEEIRAKMKEVKESIRAAADIRKTLR